MAAGTVNLEGLGTGRRASASGRPPSPKSFLIRTPELHTPIFAFTWSDVLVTALQFLAIMLAEGRRIEIPQRWLPLSALLIRPSLALPRADLLRKRFPRTAPRRLSPTSEGHQVAVTRCASSSTLSTLSSRMG
ncbi:DUF2834 domain-containing protein [Stenotrophomonas maltophilia]|uniref:DUF2834 domain-containing protein n=1 Tax=Stenotrophomonas maltophilia TaxID=40324 RepID=UPI0009BD331B|nr:DUF2834 domain-containing protein [Stenotrophomonas maltophilia]